MSVDSGNKTGILLKKKFAFFREIYATHKILLGSILSNFKLDMSPGFLRIKYIYYILFKNIYRRENWNGV